MPRPAKRSFTIDGHRTSISLEEPFWNVLKEVAKELNMPVAQIVQEIDSERGDGGLSSAVRIWLLDHYRQRLGLQSARSSGAGEAGDTRLGATPATKDPTTE